METIEKSVIIDAPVGDVFDYLTDPAHLPDIWPSMIEVKNVKLGKDGAHSFDWTYKMAGMHFHGHADTIEVARNTLRVVKNVSGIPSTFHWKYTARGDRTEVELEVEYDLPVPLLGRLAAPFLRKLNEREAQTMLANLKERFEAGTAAGEPIPSPRAGAGEHIGRP